MRTVILIGTNHKYQRNVAECDEEATSFYSAIKNALVLYNGKAIAEEMSREALERDGYKKSVADLLCTELKIPHQFSDPTNSERISLGIHQDNDIRVEHLTDGWTKEELEADVQARGQNASDRIREQFWWQRIQKLNLWPVLFICGADHVAPFSNLLTQNNVNVIEAHSDWNPALLDK